MWYLSLYTLLFVQLFFLQYLISINNNYIKEFFSLKFRAHQSWGQANGSRKFFHCLVMVHISSCRATQLIKRSLIQWECLFESERCMLDDRDVWGDSGIISGDLYSHNESRLLWHYKWLSSTTYTIRTIFVRIVKNLCMNV